MSLFHEVELSGSDVYGRLFLHPCGHGEIQGVMDILAAALGAGRNVLIHCAAGVGRTGTVAICLLADLGFDIEEAAELVYEAHSEPETEEQRSFIRRYSEGDAGR